MAKRMQDEDVQALLSIRRNLIVDHERILDGSAASHVAVVKQKDVAECISRAVKSLEEVLATAGGVEFTPTR
tara:strand:- start:310 stop:525 length:216 start_codon:yes stop_codon:yes gene_type:complete